MTGVAAVWEAPAGQELPVGWQGLPPAAGQKRPVAAAPTARGFIGPRPPEAGGQAAANGAEQGGSGVVRAFAPRLTGFSGDAPIKNRAAA
ncbi:hypothetical protein GCM10022293_22610 [Azospirillum formosense]